MSTLENTFKKVKEIHEKERKNSIKTVKMGLEGPAEG